MNSIFSFNKYKKVFFFIFSFCPKNNGFARVWGGRAAGASPRGSYAYDNAKYSKRLTILRETIIVSWWRSYSNWVSPAQYRWLGRPAKHDVM